ncbi:MAG: histidine--tRNA ligase, partial [Oscillospiraceae bacterium]
MAGNINAPRGTLDVLPTESYKWQFIEKIALEVAKDYGYNEMRTPVFEHTELFLRGVGDTTDVVSKEMYTFRDKGERSVTLKPEGTAGIARAAIERGLLNDALPFKASYITPCFRYDKPQAGRYREFHQFGIEAIGSESPAIDAEVIAMAYDIIDRLSLENITLFINSIGCPECRAKYHQSLKLYFENVKDSLCSTCRERLEKNPMRILDCKSDICQNLGASAPVMLDFLCDDCSQHFSLVKSLLQAANIPFQIDPKIVRGLDYYTKTVFEFVASDIGLTVCGGGRYDGLIQELGGNKLPGIGFAAGLERLLLVTAKQNVDIPKLTECELYIASIGEKANIKAYELATILRRDGVYVEFDV